MKRRISLLAGLILLANLSGACSTPKKTPVYPRYLTVQSRMDAARGLLEKSRLKKTPGFRRAQWQLTSARLYLDSQRIDLALPVLRSLSVDPKAPARTRARALWLELSYTKVQDPERYWEILEKFPDTVAAEDALWKVLSLSRAKPVPLLRRLLKFYAKRPSSFVADLVLFECAGLAHGHPGSEWKNYAVHLLTFLARRHPDSPRRDAALHTAARWSRELGKTREAIAFLHQLLKTRESSLFFGDYNSQWLDDAQLLLGDLYLERNEPKSALRAWSDLPNKFPDSRLRDRAWIRIMELHTMQNRPKQACAAARKLLRTIPRSRFAPQAKKLLARCGPNP